MTKQYSLGFAWLTVIIVVIVGDTLFYERYFGLNLGLYCCMLSILSFPLFNENKHKLTRWFLVLMLSLSIIFDPTVLNVIFFILIFTLNLYARSIENLSITMFLIIKVFFVYVKNSLLCVISDMKITFALLTKKSTVKKYLIKSAKNWLIAILVSHIFVGLFYSANPILENILDDFFKYLIKSILNFSFVDHLKRWAIGVFLFVVSWSVFRTHIVKSIPVNEKIVVEKVPLDLIIKLLISFNVVFLLQTISDLYFLIGGGTLPDGLTYASYAHRGAYPLIAVTLLSGLFICFVFQEGLSAQKSKIARTLVFVWLIQNILLAIFTLQRLSMYVSLFHLTRWRYATCIWIFLIITGFVLTFIRIAYQKSNSWYIKQNLTITFFVLLACCFVKSDSIIAYYNITHCLEYTGKGSSLDEKYIESLGVSSLPAIQFALDRKPSQMNYLSKLKTKILRSNQDYDQKNWQEISLYENYLLRKHQRNQ